jgi:deferrochelatase/peroxidase EfeB
VNDESTQTPDSARLTRGRLFAVSAAIGSAVGLAMSPASAAVEKASAKLAAHPSAPKPVEAFYGEHQAGIVTPQQSHTYVATFDLVATKRADIVAMLQAWTSAAERMSRGLPVAPAANGYDPTKTIYDSGEALELSPARLTLTFGFGSGLFVKDGTDRYGLAAHRPAQLVDLPRFTGDQLIEGKTGGDLYVQACADDPQVAFHAVRQLARLAAGVADMRWVQSGFLSGDTSKSPRNLMGFKDGTQTVSDLPRYVWAGSESPSWMRGGSYVVTRRIRIAMEHWDQMKVAFQEQTIGRSKLSGAPLGAKHESDPLPLSATDSDGNLVISEAAHVRVANASTNNGAQILRRGYSYNDGVSLVAERWPPWHQGMEYDAGLLFICYQRDPTTAFIPMFEKMSKLDMLNQFASHTGGGLFAIPGGVQPGKYVGQELFESA